MVNAPEFAKIVRYGDKPFSTVRGAYDQLRQCAIREAFIVAEIDILNPDQEVTEAMQEQYTKIYEAFMSDPEMTPRLPDFIPPDQ